MCAIFAYLNYVVEKDIKYILETLLNGLSRFEYRGYDSAGLAIDGDDENEDLVYKQVGKVAALHKEVQDQVNLDMFKSYTLGYSWTAFSYQCISSPFGH
ncbi:glutamine--fructose-6-phosphate transaminase (isomerizing) [Basidiobolus ranarum]|uniref:glutamine--fructose-6-phosphate transaminase (isomerizing) n=1 Tax=Basidiobolus ranarum TaxID=34480 RepID=A0ABR2WL62_9FUNG